MRNLQKILALALALIMSFSLVVTANAAFSDEADINETYSEAVNVLSGLEVFRGYTDGSYQPQASITRAEVAAIIYRIATGDVEDRQVSLYSDYNRFTDVASGSWYAGYVNYCANAEYIQGYGDGRFGPNNPVTGYEALAMILRAVGYGKMDNEFGGSNWAVQTAARANTLGVSKNVTAALLGSAASREVVAELLFRSILVPTVDYNQFNGYTETNTTLGAKLGLEEIEGVVVANERANLYGEDVLAAGKTELEIAENDIRSLDYVSGLTDIGESRYAYIRGSEVLALSDTGKNVSKESGAETDISTDKKFRDFSGLTNTEETEYYVDFGREGHYTSDYRIEFTIEFTNAAVKAEFEKDYDTGSIDDSMDRDELTKNELVSGNTVYLSFEKVIRAETEISQEQLNIIKGIFAMADDTDNSEGVTGEVYVGTRSTDKQDNRYDDLSDTISYRTFYRDYINSEDFGINWDESENGEWVKIIDNDADGKADYAFKTHYYLDKVISSYTKSGEEVLEYYFLDLDDYDVIYDAEVAVNDIVLYTLIDNQAIVEKPELVSDQIKAISFKDVTVTTDSDNTYGQSGIFNKTKMDEVITNMDEDVDYNMYLDKYGYIRAYELAAGTKYALLSELYYGYYQNGRYVTNNDLTVELTAGEEKTEEFDVLNEDGNDFVMANVRNYEAKNWAALDDKDTIYQDVYANLPSYNIGADRNVLQPATAHLAYPDTNLVGYEDGSEYFAPAVTNIAKYVQTEDGVRISSAAQQAKTTKGEIIYYTNVTFKTTGNPASGIEDRGTAKYSRTEWVDKQIADNDGRTRTALENAFDSAVLNGTYIPVYAEDYIELEPGQALAKKARRYDVADDASGANNGYVNAVHDTEYYIVSTGANGKITYFVDYDKVPAFDENEINAIYAVAHNTEADSQKADYWVADVIVIQVDDWSTDYDSVSLAFYNPYEESTRVRNLDTLNNEHSGVEATVIPGKLSWGTEWKDYGFYKLYDTTTEDNTITADTIGIIGGTKGVINPEQYGENNIFAATIVRREDVNENGGYLVVDKFGGEGQIVVTDGVSAVDAGKVSIENVDVAPVYGIDGTAADSLRLRDGENSEVVEGDQIIWVEKNNGDIAFIIDITDSNYADGDGRSYDTPTWLKNIYSAMLNHQRTTSTTTPPAPETPDLYLTAVSIKGVTGDDVEIDNEAKTVTATIPYDNWAVDTSAEQLTATPNKGTVKLFSADGTSFTSGTAVLASTQTKFYAQIVDGRDMVEYTINLTLSPAATGAALTELWVKGVRVDIPAESALADPTPDVELTAGTISAKNNADTTIPDLKMKVSDFAAVTVTDGTGTASGVGTTVTESDGYFIVAHTSGLTAGEDTELFITVTAQAGGTPVVYKVTLTAVREYATALTAAPTAKAPATLNGKVLTVPAGVTVTKENIATYLTITENVNGGNPTSETTVTVDGNKITLSTVDKDDPTATDPAILEYTWKNDDIKIVNKRADAIFVNGRPLATNEELVVDYDSDVEIEVPGLSADVATLVGATQGDDYTDFAKNTEKSTDRTTFYDLTGVKATINVGPTP